MKTTTQKLKVRLLLGLLLCTTFGIAETWNKVNSGTTKQLNTIYFPSPNVGYIGGNDSLLMKTTNGGLTWTKLVYSGVTFYPNGEHILNLQFLNDSVGFMTVGPYSGSYKTVDGGLTWTLLPTAGNQCYNLGLYFFDQNNGFIGGSGCFQSEIISHLSAGVWMPQVLPSINAFNPANFITDIDFHNSNFGLASSRSGYIFRTINGGASWDSVASSVLMNPITSILIVNDTLAYAGYETISGTGFGLYITTDGGLSWNFDVQSATFYYPDFMCLHKSGGNKIYTGGISQGGLTGLIFSNPGVFTMWDYDAVDEKINDISSYNDSIVFAVGDSGYIVVNKPLIGLGISASSKTKTKFSLFPNPAKDNITLIVSDEIKAESAHLKIYSAFGELVLDESFSNQLNISKLAQGVYFIELQMNEFLWREKFVVCN